MRIKVVADESAFVVFYKPPGVDCMSSSSAPGLFAQLQSLYPDWDLKPVHRLDKGTSGLLILAKGSANAAILAGLFASHQVQKYYVALGQGKPAGKQGSIIGDMVRSRRGQWRLSSSLQDPAVTHFFSFSVAPRLRLFIIRIYTGKTHQIRVALKSIGCPVAGDGLYGGKLTPSGDAVSDRLYLHAYAIVFHFQGHECRYRVDPMEGEWFRHQHVTERLAQLGSVDDLAWPKRLSQTASNHSAHNGEMRF